MEMAVRMASSNEVDSKKASIACGLRSITLEGVEDQVSVVDVNCNYGINDVKTLETNKLYFYMSDEEYAKLTEIIVCYSDGTKV